tara:strand:- start:119 stop:616 length:498 start_codon:yes stop_codon:yes gene_type:complete
MATPTYTLIDSVTLTTEATVTFTSIPQTFGDLVLVVNQSSPSGAKGTRLFFNGDGGSNYSSVSMYATATVGSGFGSTSNLTVGGYNTASNVGVPMFSVSQIMDYSATDKHKSVLSRSNTPTGSSNGVVAWAGRWANTSAITQIEISDGNWAVGSTFFLYGIAKAL